VSTNTRHSQCLSTIQQARDTHNSTYQRFSKHEALIVPSSKCAAQSYIGKPIQSRPLPKAHLYMLLHRRWHQLPLSLLPWCYSFNWNLKKLKMLNGLVFCVVFVDHCLSFYLFLSDTVWSVLLLSDTVWCWAPGHINKYIKNELKTTQIIKFHSLFIAVIYKYSQFNWKIS
jgi:hypothetical protein